LLPDQNLFFSLVKRCQT